MTRIKEQLSGVDGVDTVDLNRTSGSITVHYNRDKHSMEGIRQFLEDMDVVLANLTNAPSIGEGPKGSTTFHRRRRRPGQAHVRSARRHRRFEDPFAPVTPCPGPGRIARGGLKISTIPAWVFLWLAFDAFVNSTRRAPRRIDAAVTPSCCLFRDLTG